PLHPYTKGLMQSMPDLEGERKKDLYVIKGKVPTLHDVPKGCRFEDRCPFADEKCVNEEPPTFTHTEEHKVKCWHYERILEREEEDDEQSDSREETTFTNQ